MGHLHCFPVGPPRTRTGAPGTSLPNLQSFFSRQLLPRTHPPTRELLGKQRPGPYGIITYSSSLAQPRVQH